MLHQLFRVQGLRRLGARLLFCFDLFHHQLLARPSFRLKARFLTGVELLETVHGRLDFGILVLIVGVDTLVVIEVILFLDQETVDLLSLEIARDFLTVCR